jgi:DNA-directed RNA polymerase subunit F
MALKAVLTAEEHGKLGDGLKSEYKQVDGKFILDVTPTDGYELDDVSGLKSSLGKERTAKSALEKQLEKFKDLDPDAARTALTELEELKAIDPKKEADKLASTKVESAKQQLMAAHSKEVKQRDDRISALTKTVEALLIDSTAAAAIAEAKGDVELLMPHVRKHTRVKEDNGQFSVEIVDKDGNARIGDSKGGPMDIKGLIAEMRSSPTFGKAFEGDGTTGSGKQPGSAGGGMPNTLKRSLMSPEQKREYQQKHGQEAFLKLPK